MFVKTNVLKKKKLSYKFFSIIQIHLINEVLSKMRKEKLQKQNESISFNLFKRY